MQRFNQKGFTLYELVIVLFILVIITIMLPPLFISFNRLFTFQSNLADAQIQNEFAIDTIAEETRQAKGVLTSQTINSTLYTTASTTLVLEYPVFDTDGDVISNETDYGAFYLDDTDPTDLKFVFDASASSAKSDIDTTIAQDVGSIIFRYNTSDVTSTTVVTVLLETSKTLSDITATFTQSSAYSLRNQ